MKEFKIKAYYNTGYAHETIKGKSLGHAFLAFFLSEQKKFRVITGFELMPSDSF